MSNAAPLETSGVTIRLAGREIVRDVTLSFARSRLVALIGPNGAGKTTLLRALAGLLPFEGEVRLEGQPLSSLPRAIRARRIAYLPQGHQIHWSLPAREIAALGRYPHGLADPAMPTPDDEAAITRAMGRTETLHLAAQAADTLSGGERARLMLARALAVEAPILLADEPTASLDPRHQIAVMRQLQAEARNGALVVAVMHDLGLAARLADDIVLMSAGRITAFGTPDSVLTTERLRDVYGIHAQRGEINGETLLVPWDVAT
ncbi:MAG: ABC transporter ATP-binding protein [Proteobacteria bacterium]|nr:ABC transporter ATP-binding protein [Pseudomonadota bacterium]